MTRFECYKAAMGDIDERRVMIQPSGCESNYWLQTLVLSDAVTDQSAAILQTTNDAGSDGTPGLAINAPRLVPYQKCQRAPLPVAELLEGWIENLPNSAGLV
jgi:perosamine synthetase